MTDRDRDLFSEQEFAAGLGAGLRAAVLDLEPLPTTVPDARRAGRRRLVRRRRAMVGTGLLAALAGVALAPRVPGGLDRLPQRVGTASPTPETRTLEGGGLYARLYEGPARGDRIDDEQYVAAVLAAWKDSHTTSLNAERGIFADLQGEPKVVWAADTPAGPAAAVVQKVVLHPGDNLNEPEGPSALIGLVGVDDQGRPRLVADDYWKSDNAGGVSPMTAWAVDPQASVVAALDLGRPVGWSDRWSYAADGVRRMTFRPISFRDGGGSVRLPGSVRREEFVMSRLPFGHVTDALITAGIRPPRDSDGPDRRLQWAGPAGGVRLPIAGTAPVTVPDPATLLDGELRARTEGVPSREAASLWTATGRLPDGRTLLAGDQQLDGDPSHAYVLIVGTQDRPDSVMVHGGAVDPAAALPFHVRLPDGLGRVVARKGAALSWRASASDPWTAAGPDAALIPDRATQVRVVYDGWDLATTFPD